MTSLLPWFEFYEPHERSEYIRLSVPTDDSRQRWIALLEFALDRAFPACNDGIAISENFSAAEQLSLGRDAGARISPAEAA
jgi:hypothetical protein